MLSKKQYSFQEYFNDLNGRLIVKALGEGLSKLDAEDVVQNVWIKVLERLKQDKDLLHRFETDPAYSRNYIYKSVKNGIKNKLKADKSHEYEFKDNEIQISIKNSPIENPIKKRRWKPRFVELIEETISTKFKDPIVERQRENIMQKFFKEFKKVLKDDENQFLDLYQEEAERNISEVARKMGIKPTKAHDIFRRIKRKALAFEAKNKMLENMAAPAAIFDFGIFDLFNDIFRQRFVPDKKYQQIGESISEKILAELGIDAISTFSKFVK